MEDATIPAREDEVPKEPTRSRGGLVTVLALVVAVAAIAFGVYSTVRAEQLSRRVEGLSQQLVSTERLLITLSPTPKDVQDWLDSGQVQVQVRVTRDEFSSELLCRGVWVPEYELVDGGGIFRSYLRVAGGTCYRLGSF